MFFDNFDCFPSNRIEIVEIRDHESVTRRCGIDPFSHISIEIPRNVILIAICPSGRAFVFRCEHRKHHHHHHAKQSVLFLPNNVTLTVRCVSSSC
jgi:hypothetical protein